ncbi:MAG: sigma-54-dependent Fis family transcriptional regulator [Sulfuriflexus sp.]|nr:sigma-54-dependent Fis family transcriptional regulator [Sulfuriflexus sp.]
MNQATILVVEDDKDLQEALCETLALAGLRTIAANDGRMAIDVLKREQVDMVVSDVQMQRMDGHALLKVIKQQYSKLPVLLMTAHGNVQKAVEAIQLGAVDYLVKPFDAEVLVNTVEQYVSNEAAGSDFIAVSEVTCKVLQIAEKVADSEATVMITGESGTGKEVLARYIHKHSSRVDNPFIAINCAAIPENMLEATLFGYEKGAFTGAYKASVGKFEQAQGGTLLLDEISEMDSGLQAKLLRVLQEREVERLGGSELISLDVRVLATSNRAMRKEVDAGNFREDLYYRLNVFPIELPPLRMRKEDIIPIAEQLLTRHAMKAGSVIPKINSAAAALLNEHSWPGNVRELDNVLQRALILHKAGVIEAEDIMYEQATEQLMTSAVIEKEISNEKAVVEEQGRNETLDTDLRRTEHSRIIDVLKNCMGNRKIAADTLGISPRTLRYKLARMRDAGVVFPG